DSQLRAGDDPCAVRTHHQHLLAGRKKCIAKRRGVRSLEVGTEWAELFSRRGASWLQYSRERDLSRLSGYGVEPACGQGSQQDAATGRWGACSGDAGDASSAIVRERSSSEADTETVRASAGAHVGMGALDRPCRATLGHLAR